MSIVNCIEIILEKYDHKGWPVKLVHYINGIKSVTKRGRFEIDLKMLNALTPKPYGEMLGNALFKDDIGEQFQVALGMARGEPLHVALRTEPDDQEINSLHWEWLHAKLKTGPDFLLLHKQTPFSRLLENKASNNFQPLTKPALRALVVAAGREEFPQYAGLEEYDVPGAVEGIRNALGNVPCDVLSGIPRSTASPTLENLCLQLQQRKYSILHIICHGLVSPGKKEIGISLPHGKMRQVTPATLLIKELSRLGDCPPLVFLSICNSADPHVGGGLGSMAQQMVITLGVSAVVAMCDRISIETANSLAREFYPHLLTGHYIDQALVNARSGLHGQGDVFVANLYTSIDPGMGTQFLKGKGQPTNTRAVPGASPLAGRREPQPLKRDAWLRSHGYRRNPFSTDSFSAENDPLGKLSNREIFVDPPPNIDSEELLNSLIAPPSTQKSFFILGVNGSGKTMLRMQLASEIRERNRRGKEPQTLVIEYLNHNRPLDRCRLEDHVRQIYRLAANQPGINPAHFPELGEIFDPVEQIQEMERICREKFGYQSVCVLVDNVDAQGGASAEQQFAQVKDLVLHRGILTGPPAFAIFLPTTFRSYLDRVQNYILNTIDWSKNPEYARKRLEEMIKLRLKSCLKRKSSITRPDLELGKLCKFDLRDIGEQLITFGQITGQPRQMWILMYKVLDQHFAAGGGVRLADELISFATFDEVQKEIMKGL